MQRKQVIGILVNRNSGEAYAGLKIKHDFNLIYFNPEDINWRRRTIRGLYRTKYGLHYKSMPIPLVIYNRLYPHDSETIKQLMSLRPPVQVLIKSLNWINGSSTKNWLKPNWNHIYLELMNMTWQVSMKRLLITSRWY